MAAALAVSPALGTTVRFDGGESPTGSGPRPVALDNGDGPIFKLDRLAMARIGHRRSREGEASGVKGQVVINFSLTSREAVDELLGRLEHGGTFSRPPDTLRCLLGLTLRHRGRSRRQQLRPHEPRGAPKSQ